MQEMNSLTLNGKTYDCFVDDVARSSVVIGSASGENIVVSDSSNQSFAGINLYGKSTQAGTPTPTAPIDIVSVGEDGVVSVIIYGKNLVNLESGGYANASGIAYDMVSYQRTTKFYLPKGMKVVWRDSNGTKPTDVLQWKENGEYIGSYNYEDGGFEAASNDAYWLAINYYLGSRTKLTWCQLEFGNVATIPVGYVTPQSMGVTGALRGIPVTDKSLSSYTDANGQMWCADEIDLERGVYVQRCGECVIDGSSYISVSKHSNGQCFCTQEVPDILTSDGNAPYMVLSDRYATSSWTDANNKVYCIGRELVLTDNRFSDKNTALSILSVEKPKCVYPLATPIETPLTDDEIAAYKALHTNKPNTTVLNDSGAFMSMNYIADAKSYIDNKVSGIMAATVE